MPSPTLISSVPSSSLPILESQITSLSAAFVSALSILATATASLTQKSVSLEVAQISASLLVQRQQVLLATLTDSSVIASLTLQMMVYQNELQDILDSNSPYGGLIPNFGFNLAMCIIFGLYILFNIFGLLYRQWWFSVAFLCATILELLGYIGRTLSNTQDVEDIDYFLLQFICLTIAPVFTMGGIYYQLAKLATVYGEHYSRWTPILYSYTFISFDIISLVIQAVGGGMAGEAVNQFDNPKKGTHVFVGGLLVQVASMSAFLLLWFDFLYSIYIRAEKDAKKLNCTREELYNPDFAHIRAKPLFKYFNLLLTVAVLFVFTRCVYRVCELGEGWSGFLILHENYFIALDAVMISLATLVFVPFFPGFVFDGRNTSVPVKKGGSISWKLTKKHKILENSNDYPNNDYENSVADSKIYNP